jgi:hypothetical protein
MEAKYEAVSRLLAKGCGANRLLKEISKCEVLCCNCHRIRHDGNIWTEDSYI